MTAPAAARAAKVLGLASISSNIVAASLALREASIGRKVSTFNLGLATPATPVHQLLPLHRVQAPCLGFEFLCALLDGGVSVWRLDASEPHRLFGDLVDIPTDWRCGFRFLRHAGSTFARRGAGCPPPIAIQWGPSTTSTGAGVTITGSYVILFLAGGGVRYQAPLRSY